MNLNRRHFLKKSGLLASASLLAPVATLAGKDLDEAFHDVSSWGTFDPLTLEEDEFWAFIKQSYNVSAHLVNLNNGGVSPQPKIVQDAWLRYTEFSNEAPSYYMWRILEPGRVSVRRALAGLVNALPEEIAINRNATEALDTIIRGFPLAKGDEVILSKYDYPRMMNAWKFREKTEGIVLKWVDFSFPEENEEILVQKYTAQFSSKTKLLYLTHMINWCGQLLPAKKIISVAREKGVKVILDAAHTYAHIDFDVKDLDADFMGVSLHKWLCAPFGTGMMYIKKEEIDTIPTFFREDPTSEDLGIRKFEELGTRNVPGELAIANAVNFHISIGNKRKQERLHFLKNYWCDQVKGLDGVNIRTPMSGNLSGAIGMLEIRGMEPSEIEAFLFEYYKIHTVSIKYEDLSGIRITPHVYTSTEELDILVDGIKALVKKKGP